MVRTMPRHKGTICSQVLFPVSSVIQYISPSHYLSIKRAFLMSVLCVVMLIQIFHIQTVQEAIRTLQKAAYVKDMNSCSSCSISTGLNSLGQFPTAIQTELLHACEVAWIQLELKCVLDYSSGRKNNKIIFQNFLKYFFDNRKSVCILLCFLRR